MSDYWKTFWCEHQLPQGMGAHGVVILRDGEAGVLLSNGIHFYMGNHGKLRQLPDLVDRKPLPLVGDKIEYQGKTWTYMGADIGHMARLQDEQGHCVYPLMSELMRD
jgi:hypothetical protein